MYYKRNGLKSSLLCWFLSPSCECHKFTYTYIHVYLCIAIYPLFESRTKHVCEQSLCVEMK